MIAMRRAIPPSDALALDYQTAAKKRRRLGLGEWTLLAITGYFVASSLTLPLLDALWLGELPLLAIVQVPKMELARWLQSDVVRPTMAALGLSQGSPSRDHFMTRPLALAIVYVLVLGPVLTVLWRSGRMTRSSRFWACIVLLAAAIDFVLTLRLAGGPGLTIY